jgi:hypothetical protein
MLACAMVNHLVNCPREEVRARVSIEAAQKRQQLRGASSHLRLDARVHGPRSAPYLGRDQRGFAQHKLAVAVQLELDGITG